MLLDAIERPAGFDRLTSLVHDLAITGLSNEDIANVCGVGICAVESALSALRKGGYAVKRTTWNANTLKRALGVAGIISRNLFHAGDDHAFVVKIAAELGRTTDWVYAMVIWYRGIMSDARVYLAGDPDASIPELQNRLFKD